MTTWENIDKTNSLDNVTVTSDEAFERVTSDIKDEYTESDGSLKQNTAWLINEIPNISILDISDFLIENKKTLYDRQNWNIVVGKAGRSIEAQPQDIARLIYNDDRYDADSYDFTMPFDTLVSASNITTYSLVWSTIKISVPWVYRVSYWWSIWTASATEITVWVWKNNSQYIVSDNFMSSSSLFSKMSWWKTARVECNEWDTLSMNIQADYEYISVFWYNDTYLEVQYIQQSL